MTSAHQIIIGGGVFGVTAALALRARGFAVTLLDPGPIPHPLASSTDMSKAVRPDYGDDALYTDLMIEALAGWRAWNAGWARPLYHETGVAFLRGSPAVRGTFEGDSAHHLAARGVMVDRLDAAAIERRFPQWAPGRFVDGYVNPAGGWAESGAVVAALAAQAAADGVTVRAGCPALQISDDGRAVRTADGWLRGDGVVVAAGAWTPSLVPELADRMWPTAQNIFLTRPPDPAAWAAPRYLTFGADISTTGWYGFPITAEGLLKIAHHGEGFGLHPDAPRVPSPTLTRRFEAFVATHLPGLVGAPLVETRVCLYCDTFDGDLFIGRHPDRPGLVVAAGGSGHGFKFAPVLGDLVAAVVTDAPHPMGARFGWRAPGRRGREDARAEN